jgi:4-aminobutyrate aminotransferase-like enzyme
VVRAGQLQMAVLNTNTRYLHENLVEYARRLTAMLPAPLRVCFFVNSGSEANELALRLARAHTHQKDMVVVDVGYHGNTTSSVDISPYKHNHKGGMGAPDWVHVIPIPDCYRGAHNAGDAAAGQQYAQHVAEAIQKIGTLPPHYQAPTANVRWQPQRGVAGFICESVLSCGGQIVLPPNYLRTAYAHVRAAGGVCIADEVQTGFGRVGSHFWAFETQGVVPDIVTMGKPMGNGHPLGAVVTTPEIATSFNNGLEYFNTFGGNAVSCAIGMAVLDVLEQEQLQAQALRVGNHLLAGLRRLMGQHDIIGDVRGLGLFCGFELVRNRISKAPATEAATYVVNRLKDHGILLSTDGPFENVVKIKPPLCFDESNADFLLEMLDKVLRERLT